MCPSALTLGTLCHAEHTLNGWIVVGKSCPLLLLEELPLATEITLRYPVPPSSIPTPIPGIYRWDLIKKIRNHVCRVQVISESSISLGRTNKRVLCMSGHWQTPAFTAAN